MNPTGEILFTIAGIRLLVSAITADILSTTIMIPSIMIITILSSIILITMGDFTGAIITGDCLTDIHHFTDPFIHHSTTETITTHIYSTKRIM